MKHFIQDQQVVRLQAVRTDGEVHHGAHAGALRHEADQLNSKPLARARFGSAWWGACRGASLQTAGEPSMAVDDRTVGTTVTGLPRGSRRDLRIDMSGPIRKERVEVRTAGSTSSS
jgi:hypothetical protein